MAGCLLPRKARLRPHTRQAVHSWPFPRSSPHSVHRARFRAKALHLAESHDARAKWDERQQRQ